MEDVDTPRCVTGADQRILQQLATCGLMPDAPVMWQSQRNKAYQAALDTLIAKGWAYPCGCSRKDIEDAQALMGHARAPPCRRLPRHLPPRFEWQTCTRLAVECATRH